VHGCILQADSIVKRVLRDVLTKMKTNGCVPSCARQTTGMIASLRWKWASFLY
jgi:hypothetical protein